MWQPIPSAPFDHALEIAVIDNDAPHRRAANDRESSPFFVAVGASGRAGLNDIKALLVALPSELAAVVLIVLHRPSDRISHLREVLSRVSSMPVLIAEEDDQFHAGSCYIGKGNVTLDNPTR